MKINGNNFKMIRQLNSYILNSHLPETEQDLSVWPFRSKPFRSRDVSVLVLSVSRHFGQTMKSCRNLTG